jgi:predicted permease
MPTLIRDLRHSLRTLWKNPGFAALVVLSLALGIGANTAMFSAIDTLLIRSLPVRNPQSLYLLQWSMKTMDTDPFLERLEGNEGKDEHTGGATSYSVSYPAYQRLQNNTVFSDTFAFAANEEAANIVMHGKAASAVLQGVSGNFFASLGLVPAAGRTILPADDTSSAVPVGVVSYGFWQGQMGGEADAIGKSISVNGTPIEIVGIAPPEFFGVDPGVSPDMWISLSTYAQQWLKGNVMFPEPPLMPAEKTWWVGVAGRLKPGVSVQQANAELGLLFQQSIRASDPKLPANTDFPQLQLTSMAKGLDNLRTNYSESFFLLMGMVGLVLLMACANIAGLLMARTASRQREIAMRISLGASRAAIVRQLLLDSVLLGVIGGACGLLVARWAGGLLAALLKNGRDPLQVALHLDGRVLAFTAVVSIVSGILFGLGPALAAIRVQPLTTLKANSGTVTMNAGRFRTGKVLVAAQVALGLILLIGAGLLLRTLRALQHVNLGYDRQSVVLFTVRPGLNGYSGDKLLSYYDELLQRIRRIPGVRTAALADRNPIGGGGSITMVSVPGYTENNKKVLSYHHMVGPGYFDTLGIPILMGRAIGEQDTAASQHVVLVNQAFVKKYFHGNNPLGHDVEFGVHTGSGAVQIVGVVQDVKYEHIRDEAPPTLYVAFQQAKNLPASATFELKTAGDPNAVVRALEGEALAVNPDVPPVEIHTQDEVLSQALYLERTFALLSSAFGALALLLACIGVYGTIAYTVAQRTNEIGIRMALGAQRAGILGMVIRETLVVVAAGLLVGLPLAWIGGRLLTAQVYGLSPHDPITWLVAVVAIAAVTLAAGFVPARRASNVDPLTALRYE